MKDFLVLSRFHFFLLSLSLSLSSLSLFLTKEMQLNDKKWIGDATAVVAALGTVGSMALKTWVRVLSWK